MKRAPSFLSVQRLERLCDGLARVLRGGFPCRQTKETSFATRIACIGSVAPTESTAKRRKVYAYCEAALIAIALLVPGCVQGQALKVRHRVGSEHGFLVLRSAGGAILASGELIQAVHGDRIKLRVVFRFRDGSIDDETTVFSQGRTFLLISDRHLQKGRSFPKPCDINIDMRGQQVSVRDLSKGGEPAKTEHLVLPADLSNGILFLLIQNLPANAGKTEVPFLAASPKPRLVKLAIAQEGEAPFTVGGHAYKAAKYIVKVELGGVEGVVAPMIGKQPADSHVWVTEGSVPEVIRVDTALYPEGPVWIGQSAGPDR
jgi:hypothetical protein